jgi:hypothetical protein
MAWEARLLIKEADATQMKKLFERLKEKEYIFTVESGISQYDKPEVNKVQTVYYFTYEGKNYGLGMPVLGSDNTIKPDSEKGVFYELFGRYSASREKSRLAISIFLNISLCFFLIVLIQHIWSGGVYIFQWIKGLIC